MESTTKIQTQEKLSVKELRARCQSTAPNPARESYWGVFARKFSIYFTFLFVRTRITPNQITFLSVLILFAGTACFFVPRQEWFVLGAALLFLNVILDACDGEVARFRKTASVTGTMYVEPVSHDIQYGLMFPLLGAALFLQGHSPWFLLLGGMAGIMKLLYRLLEIRNWDLNYYGASQEKLEQMKKEFDKKSSAMKIFYFLNKNFFSSTGVSLLLVVAAIVNRFDWYVVLFAIVYSGLWVLLFMKQIVNIFYRKSIGSVAPSHD